MRVDQLAAAWMRTRRALRFSSSQLEARRARQWRQLQPVLARTPALAAVAWGPWEAVPITEIAALRADYGAWNSLGLSTKTLHAMADAAEQGLATGSLSAGWSTGSSGAARGLFLATSKERADYLGQSLARLLPARALLARQRLALHLRASNALYSDVQRKRFVFGHFPLNDSNEQTRSALEAFAPTILIAPPHRLAALAEAGMNLPTLRHLFVGSEPMGEAERSAITTRLGRAPRSIYQATEGFLGAECAHSHLHLNDHSLIIELEPVPGTPGYRPIITDLRRVSQPIVRVRGDDYIELGASSCPCGFAGRIIYPPQGRVSDVWRFAQCTVTPPQVVAAMESALGGDALWQAEARFERVVLHLSPHCLARDAERASATLISKCQLPVPVEVVRDLTGWQGPKRRRVVSHHG